ncbi:MAG: hypothetical protein PUD80_01930 [Firmicutes bacterium]|nr:hypothetical protein [Bacillota bacterium]
MDNTNEPQEFDLDDILKEFGDHPEENPEEPGETDGELEALLAEVTTTVEPSDAEQLAEAPTGEPEEVSFAEAAALSFETEASALDGEETAADGEASPPVTDDDTLRFDPSEELAAETEAAPAEERPIDELIAEAIAAESGEKAKPESASPIEFNPRQRLRELKKKLVSGPEKRYYALAEVGLGKLQIAILINVIIVLLCAGVTALFVLGMVPESRLRLVIFSQVLAMLISGLLGSQQMLDGLGDLTKGRFTANTLLTVTFAACCVDSVFCLMDLRVPCCAAFCLEMTMALLSRYQRRSTEMGQMDTLRKAVHLTGLTKVPGYYEGNTGLLRTEGEVEDFMDTYQTPSAPEKLQSVYAFVCLLACIAIAVFTGLRGGLHLGVQIFATSLLVAMPASFFISISRPMAILEKRLHMVGTVLCGWQGVKGLCGKTAFPLRDEDLFPLGSTKLNGVKFYGKRDPDEVVCDTASLIIAAGGGLVPVFQQLLRSRNCAQQPVKNFQNYGTGGIGGEVCDEPVLLGSLSFLQDMGVVIPEGTMVNQAVYAAIDGQLSAVFAISYARMRSASAGLVTLCGHKKITPVVLCGDFMLTESFIRSKFGIKTRRIVFPTREERTALQACQPDSETPVLAITTREDLVSAAYAVGGAQSLRTATRLGVTIHLIGGILGMLIMLVLGYLGATELLTPTNVLLYQLVWLIPGFLVTEWTRAV